MAVARLRGVDVYEEGHDSIRAGQWVRDDVISFFFEWLSQECNKSGQAAFLDVSTSFLLRQVGPGDAAMILEALHLPNKMVVCLAINDNRQLEMAGGGSHWALLAFHRATQTFHLFDSLGASPSMIRCAKASAEALSVAVGATEASFEVEMAMPRQTNGCDCGVYTMAVAQLLCAAAQDKSWPNAVELLTLTPELVSNLRGKPQLVMCPPDHSS